MTALPSVAFSTAVLTLLDAIANVVTYDGEVPRDLPLDPDGRVHPYLVFYPGVGNLDRTALNAASTAGVWSFQVTAVGGDRQRCQFAAAAAAGALTDIRLTVSGWQSSPIVHLPGPDMARDDDPNPPRFYVPLLFEVYATPA